MRPTGGGLATGGPGAPPGRRHGAAAGDDPSLHRRCQRVFGGLSVGVRPPDASGPRPRPRRASSTRASRRRPRGGPSPGCPSELVTLTSVRRPPITSIPTKKRPSRAQPRRERSTIRRSSASSRSFAARPPTWRFARVSLSEGTRSSAPSGSPSSEQDALVALAHLGEVALRHRRPRAEARRLLEDREQVPVARAHVEDALAAAPVERLHDHLAAELRRGIAQLGDARA